ncbi:P-loop containing nucleoside triphosphate hydrolase protein [Rickenella mellea]|uniref:P-loop containing nucleoside triphosphate hydrolase protein n=1 Tax=Rickenella mellea TaxID=50990 RepID=A0A4Y7Q018_9AGAM|nr:P-loop containing nucleoside triphosphate hydrolase protein [Rickenella mellea]
MQSIQPVPTDMQDVEAQNVTGQNPQLEQHQLVLEWDHLCYSIKDKAILSDVSGTVSSGEMLAVMGPSGAGKSTILDILAQRAHPTSGKMTINGNETIDMSSLGSYVEQNDALLGVLSVRETIQFAARLSLDPSTPREVIEERVSETITGLGLSEVSSNRIGNAVQRGISGGQKRRVTIGSSLVTRPKILLLDEPTSGLDSRTSREVLLAIRNIAIEHNMIVIASIHQPNWETISLFDKLLLLAQGRTMYAGPVDKLDSYVAQVLERPVALHANPTDHALDLVNTDFFSDATEGKNHINELASRWKAHESGFDSGRNTLEIGRSDAEKAVDPIHAWSQERRVAKQSLRRAFHQTWILIERNILNYSRNLLAYGVRLGMYLGMGVLLATVWVNLAPTSAKINDRLSVHFFSVAFLGFMSVAGIPAFLEERQVFMRERLNGLYGPGAYVIANSVCTLPYLFVCAAIFAVLCYWSIGLHPGATEFFKFLAILVLAVYAAESQSAVVAAALPIFVAALAVASFLNGFWMCVGGYFIKAVNLPRFWYFWAHFIDYQTYAFDLLVVNDFRGLVFDCQTLADGSCQCDYPSSLVSQGICQIRGDDVLNALGIGGINFGLYIGILIAITLVFRILLYVVLVFKKR